MNKAIIDRTCLTAAASATLAIFLCGCGSASNSSNSTTSATESASVIAASTVSGGVSSSSGNTTADYQRVIHKSNWIADFSRILVRPAYAASCLTATTSCASSIKTITLSNCTSDFGSATWNGTETISSSGLTDICSGSGNVGGLLMSTGELVTRNFLAGTTRTDENGVVITLDTQNDSSSTAYDGTNVYGGEFLSNNSGTLELRISGLHLTSPGRWDHSISSSAMVLSGSTSSRQISSGTVTVWHNLAKYKATATLTNLTFTNTSCFPTGGSISTVLTGSQTGTETLAFIGGGQATYTSTTGAVSTITLSHCF